MSNGPFPAGGPRLRHDYTYDPAYRLTRTVASFEFEPASYVTVRDTSYNLDGVHNRLSVTGTPGPATGSYTMDPAACKDLAMNKYTTTPLDVRSYDDNGNLTSIAGTAQTVNCLYDYRNRMVEYYDSATNQRHTYAYDALGRRMTKTVDADGLAGEPTTTRYFYGAESHWQVCEEQNAGEFDPDNYTLATYVYGRYIDEVIQMQRCEDQVEFPPCDTVSPVDYYYHTDDLYNVMAVTDSSGNVVERYEYDDYGTPAFMDASGNVLTNSTIGNPYLFTGRRYDPESGWYNYRTRYLDPKSGKFTTRDVIGIWGDPAEFGNGYTYVGNNPSSWLDPLGLGAAEYVADIRKALFASCEKGCKNLCSQTTPGPDESNPEEGCTTVILVGCFNQCNKDCRKEANRIAMMIRAYIRKCNISRAKGSSCQGWAVRLRWLLNKMDLKYFDFDAIELEAIGPGGHAVLGLAFLGALNDVEGTTHAAWELLIDPTDWNQANPGGFTDQGMDARTGSIHGEGDTHSDSEYNPYGHSIPSQPGEDSEEGPQPEHFPPS